MEGVTLTIAIIFALLVIILRPGYALSAYITALLWYPRYQVVNIGTIEISVSRIVVGVLLLRCLCDSRIRRKFTWSQLDTWVAFSMVVYVVIICITQPLSSAVENRMGFLMDTWFVYMVVRFIVSDRTTLVSVIKCAGLTLAPLAILGVAESITDWRPFALLLRNAPVFEHLMSYESRWGFNRAIGPFSHSILFGCCFVIFLPLIYCLRHHKNYWHGLAYILSGVALFGGLSSMSSGPWVMTIVAIFCMAIERHKRLVKPLLIFFVSSCIFIGVASNRPFYHVIASYANPLGGSGWHRAKLVDCAIEHFDEWYLLGYGDRDPGWGESLGMTITDVTNEFILNGVRYGILGIVVLCGVLTAAFRDVLRTWKKTQDPQVRSLCWSFGSILCSLIIAWMSVSFFGQLIPLFYCILGMIGSLPNLVVTTAEGNNCWSPQLIPAKLKI